MKKASTGHVTKILKNLWYFMHCLDKDVYLATILRVTV